jgi:hypothetical protein
MDINDIYSNPIKYKIEAKIEGYSDTFDINLIDLWSNTPDCKIGHFGYNIWFRTPYGINYKKYKSIKSMTASVKKVLKSHDLILEYINITTA